MLNEKSLRPLNHEPLFSKGVLAYRTSSLFIMKLSNVTIKPYLSQLEMNQLFIEFESNHQVAKLNWNYPGAVDTGGRHFN